jgi:hypothetical protein
MNPTAHDELIESLVEIRQALPSMRLGQLIANLATVARGSVPGAIWEMEDQELLDAIRWQLRQLADCVEPEVAGNGTASDRGGVTPTS